MSRAAAMPPDDRRQAIIDAVAPLLLTQGTALTTRQIAEAAGVAEGTLFRVFESKQELLGAAAIAALQAELAVEQLHQLPAGVPLQQRVASVLEILQSEIRRTRALSMTLHPFGRPIPAGTTNHHKAFHHHERRQRLTEAVIGALDEYADDLTVPPRTAAQLLLALSFATSFDPTETNPLPGPDDVADVVLHGIARGTI
ncbi:MAG: TetR/AcrR family transcriptional regulator [Propionicimonas sp.]|nr:TetR/AcrR family transcriptional regulator [Propionicimonas sp.]